MQRYTSPSFGTFTLLTARQSSFRVCSPSPRKNGIMTTQWLYNVNETLPKYRLFVSLDHELALANQRFVYGRIVRWQEYRSDSTVGSSLIIYQSHDKWLNA